MSHITKNALKDDLSRTIRANADAATAIKSTYNNLVDSLYQVEVGHTNTTSGSNLVDMAITQPANSIIEEVTVVCTSAAAYDTAQLGLTVGTGGSLSEEIIAATTNSIATNAGALALGKGFSTTNASRTAFGGGADASLVVDSPYTSTSRTITATVSGSTGGFKNNTGEFTLAVKYIQL